MHPLRLYEYTINQLQTDNLFLTIMGSTMKDSDLNSCSECQVGCKSIFNSVPMSILEKLDSFKSYHTYRKGETIFHQDTPCFGIHCVKSGSVKVFTCEEDGREIIHRLGTVGDLLGHDSIFGKKRYFES